MKYLYKYPQAAFPYADLVETNRRRGRARARVRAARHRRLRRGPLLRRLRRVRQGGARGHPRSGSPSHNRGPEAAALHVLPTLWFRNTWSWGGDAPRPSLRQVDGRRRRRSRPSHADARRALPLLRGRRRAAVHRERDQHRARSSARPNRTPYVKDGINDYVVHGRTRRGEPGEHRDQGGGALHAHRAAAAQSAAIRLRLHRRRRPARSRGRPFGDRLRRGAWPRGASEADEFYATVIPGLARAPTTANVMRQALAGMLWTKQYYYYDVDRWLDERGARPVRARDAARAAQRALAPHGQRRHHLDAGQVGVPVVRGLGPRLPRPRPALVDPDFGKQQLDLMLRERVPAPERADPGLRVELRRREPAGARLGDHLHLPLEQSGAGEGDLDWLERAFQKLLLNFTWWVNRKDRDRQQRLRGRLPRPRQHRRVRPQRAAADRRLPGAGRRHRLDGALLPEHARDRRRAGRMDEPVYADMALKFVEHFLWIASAMTHVGDGHRHVGRGGRLLLRRAPAARRPGAAAQGALDGRPAAAVRRHRVRRRDRWTSYPDLARAAPAVLHRARRSSRRLHPRPGAARGDGGRRLASVLDETRAAPRAGDDARRERVPRAPTASASLSRYHADHPYVFPSAARSTACRYLPAESDNGMFGGNSNWRGPDLDARQRPHHPRPAAATTRTTATSFTVECPTGSGRLMNLYEVAEEITRRLAAIFLRDARGRRRCTAARGSSRTIRTGAISSCSTSTSTATTAPASAPATRRAGPVSSRARMHLFATSTRRRVPRARQGGWRPGNAAVGTPGAGGEPHADGVARRRPLPRIRRSTRSTPACWLDRAVAGLGRAATLDDMPDAELDEVAAAGLRLGLAPRRLADRRRRAARVARRTRSGAGSSRSTLPDLARTTSPARGSRSPGTPCIAALGGDAGAGAPARAPAAARAAADARLRPQPHRAWITRGWTTTPSYFVAGTEGDLAREPQNYTRVDGAGGTGVLAHGRDPYFSGWPDTLQLDYANPDTQEAMAGEL